MQKTKLPNVVTILVLTLITVVMWIGYNIYIAITSAPESVVPQNISQPLTPTLDIATVNKIESALYFNESQIPQITFSSPSGTPTATTIPVATPEAIPTGVASPSATISPSATPSATPTGP